MPAAQAAADALQSHFGLQLFAAQSTPLSGHTFVECGKVSRAELADDLIAERMTFRLGRKGSACARSSYVERVHTPDALRFREEHGNAIGKRRHQVGKEATRLIRLGIEAMGERCGCARELLRVPAAQLDMLTRHAATPHARLESLHISDADA